MATAGAQSNGKEAASETSYEEVLQSVGLGLKCMREALQQQCQDAQHQLEKRLQEALHRLEQNLQNDFRQQLQEVQRLHDRRLQEALRQQELSLQHDFRKLLKDSAFLILQKMQATSPPVESLEAKPTRERQALELVAELLEEASLRAEQRYASTSGGRRHQVDLEARMVKLEASMEKALGDVFPRVNALLTRLDEPHHPLTPSSLSFISNFSSASLNPVPFTESRSSTSNASTSNSSNPSASLSRIPSCPSSDLSSSGSELTSHATTTASSTAVPTSSISIPTTASNSNSTSVNSAADSYVVIPTSASLNTTSDISASNSSTSNSYTHNLNANTSSSSVPKSVVSTSSASTSPQSYTTSVPITSTPASSTSNSTPTCSISSTSTSFVSITKSSFTSISTPSTSSTSNASTPYSSTSTSCSDSPAPHHRSAATALQTNDNSSTAGVDLMNELGEAVLDGRVDDARRLFNEGVSSFVSWIKQ